MSTPNLPAWIRALTFEDNGLVKASTKDRSTTVYIQLPIAIRELLNTHLPATLKDALRIQVSKQLADEVKALEHSLADAVQRALDHENSSDE